MVWQKLGTTTISGTSESIDVSGLEDKKFLQIINHTTGTSASLESTLAFNSDISNIYARRASSNGATDVTSANALECIWSTLAASTTGSEFVVGYVINISTEEKLVINFSVIDRTLGAATAPDRAVMVNKWTNTSDPIDEVTINLPATTTFSDESNCTVLGTN